MTQTKEERSAYDKIYYEKNKERILQRKKKYYLDNREEILIKDKEKKFKKIQNVERNIIKNIKKK